MGVAITSTFGCSFCSAAGFKAGSIPTIGSAGYMLRIMRTAALVAVLQATTTPFAPSSNKILVLWKLSLRTSSSVFVP